MTLTSSSVSLTSTSPERTSADPSSGKSHQRSGSSHDAAPKTDWRCRLGREHYRTPCAFKLVYAAGTPAIAAVYADRYGIENFLWLSDIALGLTTTAVIAERPLPASLAAVSVLPLELAWNVDFVARGRLFGLAGYMFDRTLPRWLRALSLFHVVLPPTLFWLLREFGYDRRAFAIQCGITWTVLPLTYALTDPAKNINWVFGPGARPQHRIPPLLYLTLAMLAFPLLVHWPTHASMRWLFPAPWPDRQSR